MPGLINQLRAQVPIGIFVAFILKFLSLVFARVYNSIAACLEIGLPLIQVMWQKFIPEILFSFKQTTSWTLEFDKHLHSSRYTHLRYNLPGEKEGMFTTS